MFLLSIRRRKTRCALGTGVQTCALPILPLADARAQVGELAVVPHDSASDQQWLDRLAQGCARYTPLVALDAPDGLILDIAGAEHLYGGEAGLIVDAEMRLARLGMTLRSEEHTSELQSLMRISYAVLCLQKKNK